MTLENLRRLAYDAGFYVVTRVVKRRTFYALISSAVRYINFENILFISTSQKEVEERIRKLVSDREKMGYKN